MFGVRLIGTACIVFVLSISVKSELMYRRSISPIGWNLHRRADVSAPLHFMFALKQRNLEVLESKFWSVSDPQSSEYRQYMSIEEINNLIGPDPAHMKIVTDWLLMNGVTAKQIQFLGDALEVNTQVSVAERLFQTKFYQFIHQTWGKMVIRQFGSYFVPAKVAACLDLITGVSNFPPPYHGAHPVHIHPRHNFNEEFQPADAQLGVVAQTAYSLYNIPSQTFGNATKITSQGVIEFESQFYLPSDLQMYANATGIQISPLTDDHIVGDNYYTYPGIEATLDIQFISTVNTEATNWFWIEDFSDSAWMYGFATHFAARTTVPQVISISYGWYEAEQCYADPNGCDELGVDDEGYVIRMNTEFQKIGLRGVTILVSSGDSGAHTRTDEQCTAPTLRSEFPAASPYVTSVGATQIENGVPLAKQPKICSQFGVKCAGSGSEVAVSYDVAKFTSGGGFSEVADQPSYQAAAVKAYLTSGVKLPDSSMYNASRRGHPDVAAVGNMNLILADYQIEAVGGTSAAAPIFAAIVSLLNQASIAKSGKTLGFINPLLYQIWASQPSAFNDITSGDNVCTESGCAESCQGWYATKGWDPVSGLGTPNYQALLNYITTH